MYLLRFKYCTGKCWTLHYTCTHNSIKAVIRLSTMAEKDTTTHDSTTDERNTVSDSTVSDSDTPVSV